MDFDPGDPSIMRCVAGPCAEPKKWVIAGQPQGAAGSENGEIGGGPVRLRAVLPEGCDGHGDESRIPSSITRLLVIPIPFITRPIDDRSLVTGSCLHPFIPL